MTTQPRSLLPFRRHLTVAFVGLMADSVACRRSLRLPIGGEILPKGLAADCFAVVLHERVLHLTGFSHDALGHLRQRLHFTAQKI